MLRIAICDDLKDIGSEIEQIIINYGKKEKVKLEVEVFTKGEDLLNFIKNEHKFDLIFLDIELISTTGVKVSQTIRNDFDDHISKIVFVTAKNGYEMELFDIQPFNFIKKPIDVEKIENCLRLLIKITGMERNLFEYKIGHDNFKIRFEEILFFESKGRKVKMVTFNGEYVFYNSLNNVKNSVPNFFVIPHTSYLVNYNNTKTIGRNEIIMVTGDVIPISQRNANQIRKQIAIFEQEKRR